MTIHMVFVLLVLQIFLHKKAAQY